MRNALLYSERWKQALEYKNQFVPDMLYHYFQLFDANYYSYRKKNRERLDGLKNKKIWISSCEALNDPFEFNGLLFDPDSNEVLRANIENVEKILRMLKNNFQLNKSLTSTPIRRHGLVRPR